MSRVGISIALATVLLWPGVLKAQTSTGDGGRGGTRCHTQACPSPKLHTIDGGGGTSLGGGFRLSGTIGQAVAGQGPMTRGGFVLTSGFWPAVVASTGVPAATVTAAVTRKANASGPGGVCDLPLVPGIKSEPRQGGVTEVRIAFDVAPGGPGTNPVTIEQATCAAPSYVPYSGAATLSATVAGNELVLTFTPGLENARKYRIGLSSDVTSIAGQFVELRGLVGDATGDGLVNAADRSAIVGVWTGSGFSCITDINSNGQTNAGDRSAVVGAWTSPAANCAP